MYLVINSMCIVVLSVYIVTCTKFIGRTSGVGGKEWRKEEGEEDGAEGEGSK